MPKIAIKKGSVSLDMTAMCDVAFLLLTFFVLTAKAKPIEPVEVMTPSSIVELPVPDLNIITILIDKKGRVCIGMDNNKDARVEWLNQLSSKFSLTFTEEQKTNFKNGGVIPVPAKELGAYLDAKGAEKKTFDETTPGISVDSTAVGGNELSQWLLAARTANQMVNVGTKDLANIVIKADSKAPYSVIRRVMKTLTNQNVNRFSLLTSQGSRN